MGITIIDPKKAEILKVKGCDVEVGQTIYNDTFGPMLVLATDPVGSQAVALQTGFVVRIHMDSFYSVVECSLTYEFVRKERK